MAETRYNVVFRGEIASDKNLAQVKEKIAALYKWDLSKVERLFFSGKPIIVKHNLNFHNAQKVQRILNSRTGAIFKIVAAKSPEAQSVPEKSEDSPRQEPSASQVYYDIFFYGEIVQGQNIAAVTKNLAQFLTIPGQKVDSMFTGARLTLKERLEYQQAEQYRAVFERTGAVCRIELAGQITGQPITTHQTRQTPDVSPISPNKPRGKGIRSTFNVILLLLLLLLIGGSLFLRSQTPLKSMFSFLSTPAPEKARETLSRMGIDYSERSFIEQARNNDMTTIDLFLDAGMDVNIRDANGSTALMAAAYAGNIAMVKDLLDKGADLKIADNKWHTAFTHAIFGNSTEILQYFLDKGIDVNAAAKDGTTALMRAASNGRIEIIRILLNAGAEVNTKTNRGETALMWAVGNDQAAAVKLLLDAGADVHVKAQNGNTALLIAEKGKYSDVITLLKEAGASHMTPLMIAAQKGDTTAVEALIKAGVNIDETDQEHAKTALFLAIDKGHLAGVKALVNAGSNLNLQDKYDTTPLMYAAYYGYTEIVRFLLEHGADPNILANRDRRRECGSSALIYAAQAGYADIVEILLREGANIKIRNPQSLTAFLLAVQNGHQEVLRLLLEAGSPVDEQGGDKSPTALIIAAKNNRPEITRFLIDAGANMSKFDSYGQTAMARAIENGHVEVVKVLIEKGDDVTRSDNWFIRPLEKAEKTRHTEIIQLLKQAGAK